MFPGHSWNSDQPAQGDVICYGDASSKGHQDTPLLLAAAGRYAYPGDHGICATGVSRARAGAKGFLEGFKEVEVAPDGLLPGSGWGFDLRVDNGEKGAG